MIQRAHYMEAIAPFIGKNIIKVLVGVRRSGKSTLLHQVAEQLEAQGVESSQIIFVDLESAANMELSTASQLLDFVTPLLAEKGKTYLFFDEIQEVEGWEKALRSLMVDHDVDLYVTGSNAHLLSSDLATYITGRYVQISVYPFSFGEFVEALEACQVTTDRNEAFARYVAQGGFPFQMELDFVEGPSLQYLQDLYATVLFRDIVQKNRVRDADQLGRIVAYALEQIGHTFSAKSVADFLKSERRSVSVDTVYSYLSMAEEACLLYRVKREDAIGKQALRFQEKFYGVDQGLRMALGNDNRAAIDQVLENIVFMELKRRGYAVTVGKVGEKEIDFVARRGGDTAYFQVTYLLASEETVEREFAPLEAIPDNYPKYVLSLDPLPRSRNGIESRNIVAWLLGE